ncbi:hypothetical protein B296_00025845 [Ensete ventricosum]|uniref:Uncharacterized protein n=1 Tax=Ensete ventricosum TaxID=4639 RepID=A0A426ZQE1_ENSVE|nr:hypothetical protein B296_00025845 [Ensete ventricosum]
MLLGEDAGAGGNGGVASVRIVGEDGFAGTEGGWAAVFSTGRGRQRWQRRGNNIVSDRSAVVIKEIDKTPAGLSPNHSRSN